MATTNTNTNDIDLEQVKNDLYTIFKSPNPLSIYINSKNVKDKFSAYLTSLSKKISDGFKIEEDNKTFVFQIYKNSGYEKVWFSVLENYLRDCRNFDLLSYLYFVKTLNKDKQYLAKGLLKMYQKVSKDEIQSFLTKYNAGISYESIEKIFNEYAIGTMDFSINLREDFVEHFIEKIYVNLGAGKRELFMDNFILKLTKDNLNFSDMSKVVTKVISSYQNGEKQKTIEKTITSEYFNGVKTLIDDYIKKYPSIRGNFYVEVSDVLSNLSGTDRSIFWQYIRTKMMDLYFPKVKYLFYSYGSNNFVTKDMYSLLKGDFRVVESISPEAESMYTDYNEINDLRGIILQLNDNIFSPFLLPVVYYTISEKLSISKNDLHKMKYLLLYIFAENYSEYKKIFMFFNQLEIFLNYEEKSNILGKFQVGFSVIMLVFFSLVLSYYYLPIGVFLGILLLSLVKYVEIGYPNLYFNQKWNIGVKFFAIVFLCVSSYYWFQNFDKIKEDSNDLAQTIENLGAVPARDVIDGGVEYVKASILEFNKGMK